MDSFNSTSGSGDRSQQGCTPVKRQRSKTGARESNAKKKKGGKKGGRALNQANRVQRWVTMKLCPQVGAVRGKSQFTRANQHHGTIYYAYHRKEWTRGGELEEKSREPEKASVKMQRRLDLKKEPRRHKQKATMSKKAKGKGKKGGKIVNFRTSQKRGAETSPFWELEG